MDSIYIGMAAGVATSFLWTATSLFFSAAAKRVGPTVVNASRIVVAVLLLGVTHRYLSGLWIPEVCTKQVLLLAASGFVGLSIGDQALFVAFVDIGPRLAMLVMTTSPIMAALFGWLALGERLSSLAMVGIALTVAGVSWVVLERPVRKPGAVGSGSSVVTHRTRGIVLALVASACQAGGLMLSKQGMGHGWMPREEHLDPQAATLVRMVFAGLGMVPILLIHSLREKKRRRTGVFPNRTGQMRSGMTLVCCGAVVGPFLGVWMSLVASDRAPLGVAQTLCSLSPIFLLPIVAIMYKERVSPRAVFGAVIAVAGSALLFVRPSG